MVIKLHLNSKKINRIQSYICDDLYRNLLDLIINWKNKYFELAIKK